MNSAKHLRLRIAYGSIASAAIATMLASLNDVVVVDEPHTTDTRGTELLRNLNHTLSHGLPDAFASPHDQPMLIESGDFKTTTKRYRSEKLSPAKKLLLRQQQRNLK